jgi:hypothetical protein
MFDPLISWLTEEDAGTPQGWAWSLVFFARRDERHGRYESRNQ